MYFKSTNTQSTSLWAEAEFYLVPTFTT